MESIGVFLTVGMGRAWRLCVDNLLHTWLDHSGSPAQFLLAQLAFSLATGIAIGALPIQVVIASALQEYLRIALLIGFVLSYPFIAEGALVRRRRGARRATGYLLISFLGVPTTSIAGYFLGLPML